MIEILDIRRCSQGHVMFDDEQFCVTCGEDIFQAYMEKDCPKCKYRIYRDGESFCPKCGSELE